MSSTKIHIKPLSYLVIMMMIIGVINIGYASKPTPSGKPKTRNKSSHSKNKRPNYYVKSKNKKGRHISNTFNSKSIPGSKNSIKSSSITRRGNTGRIKPRNLKERFNLTQFKQNPHGKRLIPMKSKLKDPRWKRGGWKKYFVEGTNIHFLRRLKGNTHQYDDIKFKSKLQNHPQKKGQRMKFNLSNQFYARAGKVGKGRFAQFYHAAQGRNQYYKGRRDAYFTPSPTKRKKNKKQ